MAFQQKNLTVIGYANGWTLWHYKTPDSIEEIEKDASYFGNLWALAGMGDVMYITSQGRTYTRQIIEIKQDFVKIGE
jgi:hypothetical protein